MIPLRRSAPFALFLGAAMAAAGACEAQEPGERPGGARGALLRGDYERAIESFREAAREEGSAAAYRGWVRALTEVGRYDEAEEAASAGVAAGFEAALSAPLGEILMRTGRPAEAEEAFGRAVDLGAPDAPLARYHLGEILFRRGERDAAMAIFDSFIDFYNVAARLDSEALEAVGLAVRRLGRRDPVLFQDALKALDEAVQADPGNYDARVALGDLFLDKYDAPSARTEYEAVLESNPNHPGALLGMARLFHFESDPGWMEMLQKALEVNPNLVPGRVFLASIRLEAEDRGEAVAEAERALEVDPTSLEALTLLGAAHLLSGETARFQDALDSVLSLNPGYGDFFVKLAEIAADARRYADAVEYARRATELDERSWEGYGLLGINQMRIGLIAEGRANLERAFAGDPYNVWFKNTLDLLDTFEYYEITHTEHFELFIREDESGLLAPMVGELAEEAYAALVARYGYEPPTPIRLELFPNSSDFSVRTVGLTGMGALGVAFGKVMAMDSPSARERGEFNWASVLWHELSHVFHLGVSDHRVPRWFTEGLAVHEQRKARPWWGHQATPSFLKAYLEKRLNPFSELNEGFVRPGYPEHIVHSYYQSSLVFQLIEEEWGWDAIIRMLRGYGQGATTEELVPRVLGISVAELDDRFDQFMGDRFARPASAMLEVGESPLPGLAAGGGGVADLERRVQRNPDTYPPRIGLARALIGEGRHEEALPHLERARDAFPNDPTPNGVYWQLALVHREAGRLAEAEEALETLVALNENHFAANLALADLRKERGNRAGEAEALARAVMLYPFDPALQTRTAELHESLEDWEGAVRARRAVVALDPVDRAEALYTLARALFRSGDRAEARTRVLESLEIAPSYEPALELLLEIRGGVIEPAPRSPAVETGGTAWSLGAVA